MTQKAILFTDGGARGNPGNSGSGCVLFTIDYKLIDFDAKFLGIKTNNQAEYMALINGLELALNHQISELNIFMDSELIVKQLKGEYKVKDEKMILLKKSVDNLFTKFKSIEIKHVKREKNSFADKLVNLVLDSAI